MSYIVGLSVEDIRVLPVCCNRVGYRDSFGKSHQLEAWHPFKFFYYCGTYFSVGRSSDIWYRRTICTASRLSGLKRTRTTSFVYPIEEGCTCSTKSDRDGRPAVVITIKNSDSTVIAITHRGIVSFFIRIIAPVDVARRALEPATGKSYAINCQFVDHILFVKPNIITFPTSTGYQCKTSIRNV